MWTRHRTTSMWPTCFGYATSTNLFTVFGEPDIEINKTRDAYVVNPKGSGNNVRSAGKGKSIVIKLLQAAISPRSPSDGANPINGHVRNPLSSGVCCAFSSTCARRPSALRRRRSGAATRCRRWLTPS